MPEYPQYIKPKKFDNPWDRFDYHSCLWLDLYDNPEKQDFKTVEYGFDNHLYGQAKLYIHSPTQFILHEVEINDKNCWPAKCMIIKYDSRAINNILPVNTDYKAFPITNGKVLISTFKLYTVWEIAQ